MPSRATKRTALSSVLCSLFFAALPLFSQTTAREQGLITTEPYWRQALGGEVLSLPHVQAQSAVVALDGGNIKAYSTIGTPMWNYSAKGRISPYVTRSREGSSYISRTNGILIAVNRSGRELWRRNLENPLCAKVVIGWDGRLFVPTDKKIFCYTASGNLLWIKTFEDSFTIAPKLDQDGGILFALANSVCRLDPFGNANEIALSGSPSFIFLIEDHKILIIYPTGVMEILGDNQDWYIGAQSDAQSARLPSLPARPLAAAFRGNEIAAILNDGRTAVVSVSERKILWTANSHIREMINSGGTPEAEAEILFDERGVYVLSRNGATGFTHAGRRNWFTILQNSAAIPAFGDDGVLYSGGRDWILYAYKLEDRNLSQKYTIYGPAPEGSYEMGKPRSEYIPNIALFEDETRAKLEEIRKAANAGNVGSNEPEWTTFLLTLSASRENLVYRIAAINLLGKLGSRETIPWLINIFNKESESSVRVAAINAIGSIGVDPDGIAIQTFLNSIIMGQRDDQILTAIASAAGALCRFSGPPLSETGIRILNLLSAGHQPPNVKRQATREFASLRINP